MQRSRCLGDLEIRWAGFSHVLAAQPPCRKLGHILRELLLLQLLALEIFYLLLEHLVLALAEQVLDIQPVAFRVAVG